MDGILHYYDADGRLWEIRLGPARCFAEPFDNPGGILGYMQVGYMPQVIGQIIQLIDHRRSE